MSLRACLCLRGSSVQRAAEAATTNVSGFLPLRGGCTDGLDIREIPPGEGPRQEPLPSPAQHCRKHRTVPSGEMPERRWEQPKAHRPHGRARLRQPEAKFRARGTWRAEQVGARQRKEPASERVVLATPAPACPGEVRGHSGAGAEQEERRERGRHSSGGSLRASVLCRPRAVSVRVVWASCSL